MDPYYVIKQARRICQDLKIQAVLEQTAVTAIAMTEGRYAEPEHVDAASLQPFPREGRWGGFDRYVWFRFAIDLPAAEEHQEIRLDVRTDGSGSQLTCREFLLFMDGRPVQGLDRQHGYFTVPDACAGKRCRFDLQAYAGRVDEPARLSVHIQRLDRRVEAFTYDMFVPCQIAEQLPEHDQRRLLLINAMDQAMRSLDLRQPYSEAYYASLAEASAILDRTLPKDQPDELNGRAICVGHTHIDVAWLWPLSQTRDKTARSFATALRLIDQYPDYVFFSSQPQLYQFIEQDRPDLFERIRKAVAEGRWEADGGMWVEADCNLISGESFVRQFQHGDAYFRRVFGHSSRVLWLPDVFGYSAAMPQILRKCGIDYFMTTKINWNQYNRMIADTFIWEGIDGSTVLSHLIPTSGENQSPDSYFSTYNGYLAPGPLIGGWRNYRERPFNPEFLVAYGYGDGGGGSTPDMIEQGRRLKAGIAGCPRVVFDRVASFFDRAADALAEHPKLRKWIGELYFEYHRGTYTSMARNKKYNRLAEIASHDAEAACTLASLITGSPYPRQRLWDNWQIILLNQFHDILPGSSIEEVYVESQQQYEHLLIDNRQILGEALAALAKTRSQAAKPEQPVPQTTDDESSLTTVHDFIGQDALTATTASVRLYNLSGVRSPRITEIPLPTDLPVNPTLRLLDGDRSLPVQVAGGSLRFQSPEMPTYGFKDLLLTNSVGGGSDSPNADADAQQNSRLIPDLATDSGSTGSVDLDERPKVEWRADSRRLRNRFLDIQFNDRGQMISIRDRVAQREVLLGGQPGNVFRLFEDKPMANQNWDIELYHQNKSWTVDQLVSADVIEAGPVSSALRLEWRFLNSRITQTIRLYTDLPYMECDSEVDWQEDEVLLKVEFPVDVHTDSATYDIQFGNLCRPTHRNTSWDLARFEVCAHKWADLSEGGYGVSLINDCKYGHDIHDQVMRLTLIKSGMEPNPRADREIHRFRYALYPHAGTWREAGTMHLAYAFNMPLHASVWTGCTGAAAPALFSLAACDEENVLIETLKQTEDEQATLIRVFEYHNRRTYARIRLGLDCREVVECDLLERILEDQPEIERINEREIAIEIKPYEIRTMRIIWA